MKVLLFVLRILGYIWALPLNVVGVPFFLYGLPFRWIRWDKGILEIGVTKLVGFKTTGGQTHGWVSLYNAPSPEEVRPGLRIHEHWHGVQGMVGGVFYGISYCLFFLVLWAWYRNAQTAYYAIPWEVWALAKERGL